MLLKIFPSKKKLFGKAEYSANVTILENKNIKCINCKRNIESGELVFETGRFNKYYLCEACNKAKGVLYETDRKHL